MFKQQFRTKEKNELRLKGLRMSANRKYYIMKGNKKKLQLPANLGVVPDFPFNKNNTFLFVILLSFLFDISIISTVPPKISTSQLLKSCAIMQHYFLMKQKSSMPQQL